MRSGRVRAASPSTRQASNPALSPDGRWLAFVAGGELLLRRLPGGPVMNIPTAGLPLDPQLARDAKAVVYTEVSKRDGTSLVRVWDERQIHIVGPGSDPSISADGTKIAFVSRADNLDPAKKDDTEAVFVRDMARGKTVLVSAPSNSPAAPPQAPAPLRARPVAGAARTISIFDNQFAGGEPVVHVRVGSVVGWDWRGNESHNVTVRSGPDHIFTRFKSGGQFAHRFTRPGRYQIVCSLHSPGMGMTLVVS